MAGEDRPARVAVLASGGGSNLQALLDYRTPDGAEAPYRIALVAGDRAGAGAFARANAVGIPTAHVADPTDAGALLALLDAHDAEYVVLAGYLKLVPAAVTRAYAGRMVNVHPALLPAFGGPGMYGRRVHEAVLASGACVSGATVHLVDEAYDRGPIVAQWPVPVFSWDTPASLATRVLRAEHALLPPVVAGLVTGRIRPRDGTAAQPEPTPHADALTFALTNDQAAVTAQLELLVGRRR